METDSFFYLLFKQLPETLFALLGQPLGKAAAYRFESLEIKKSYRLDGLFTPKNSKLPLYFVEVQYQRKETFYSNLFAKVFSYLDANDPNQDWAAVAIFPDRAAEPKPQAPYEDLLLSQRVHRIYLEELSIPGGAPPGIMILQLAATPEKETRKLVARLRQRARQEPDCERAKVIVELIEEILIRRFTELDREEIRRMFKLHDIRKSKVWQEAHEEGREEGLEEGLEKGLEKGLEEGLEKGLEEGLEKGLEKGRALEKQQSIKRWLAKGKSLKEIADLLEIPVPEVRRLANRKTLG